MRKELARKVYDHLMKFGIGYFPPPKKDESELLFFEKPFQVTDEEGELMLHFRAYGEHIDVIAKRAGLDKKKILTLLDSLTKKCWIWREGTREEGKYWLNLIPVDFWMPYFNSKETWEELGRFRPRAHASSVARSPGTNPMGVVVLLIANLI
jgi:hypothetical protein